MGYCLYDDGRFMKDGVWLDGTTDKEDCVRRCLLVEGAKSCEGIVQSNNDCHASLTEAVRGDGTGDHIYCLNLYGGES